MAKMKSRWVVLCSAAIGAIYTAGYVTTEASDIQAVQQQAAAPIEQSAEKDRPMKESAEKPQASAAAKEPAAKPQASVIVKAPVAKPQPSITAKDPAEKPQASVTAKAPVTKPQAPGTAKVSAAKPQAPVAAKASVTKSQATVASRAHATKPQTPIEAKDPGAKPQASAAAKVPAEKPQASEPAVVPTQTVTKAAAGQTNGLYKDGTYTGMGRNRRGSIAVNVTVKNDKITDVTVSDFAMHYSESDIVGLPGEVVRKQSATVNNVSGATYSTEAFRDAVENALSQAKNA